MKKHTNQKGGFTKHILIWAGGLIGQIGLLGLTVLLVWAFQSRSMPDLQVWHTVSLTGEFTADNASPQYALKDYLEQEARLFSELQKKVFNRVEPSGDLKYSRYLAGGPQDPDRRPQNWNRTFERIPKHIRGGALLLHGLTDSPYSLRRMGETLYRKGFYVLGLRLPGHGTVPGALINVHWKDWVAASRVGAQHVHDRIGPNKPFVILGYSNGGALSVKYALDALSDTALPRPDQLVLFSPEIGISHLSVLANSHKLLSFLPYFEQFKWLSIYPEYDPYKYNSFPKNAAQQAHKISRQVQRQVENSRKAGLFKDFPPVLTFLPWVDATVKTSATIHRLYDRLENQGSQLVIFDVNRWDQLASFMPDANDVPLKTLEGCGDLPYGLTVITNRSADSRNLVKRFKTARSGEVHTEPIPFKWPSGVYSLAHVAIPFAPDDPEYGNGSGAGSLGVDPGLPLATLTPRGETGLLTVPLSQFMRIRHNPFFPLLEQHIVREIDPLFTSGQANGRIGKDE